MPTHRKSESFAKISVPGETVLPRVVREQLNVGPSDVLRYRETADGFLLDKVPASAADDAFATFGEWSSEADEKAYGGL